MICASTIDHIGNEEELKLEKFAYRMENVFINIWALERKQFQLFWRQCKEIQTFRWSILARTVARNNDG